MVDSSIQLNFENADEFMNVYMIKANSNDEPVLLASMHRGLLADNSIWERWQQLIMDSFYQVLSSDMGLDILEVIVSEPEDEG